MIKISSALMVLANIAITIAMLAAIAAHVRSASIKDLSAENAEQAN